MHKKNKRTLNKRVRRIMFLTVFITLALFTSLVIFLGAAVFKAMASAVTQYYSYSTAQEMNSDSFLKYMNIKGLEEFDPQTPEASHWLQNFSKTRPEPPKITDNSSVPLGTDTDSDIKTSQSLRARQYELFNPGNLVIVEITLNNKIVYSSKLQENSGFVSDNELIRETSKSSGLIRMLLDFYNVEDSDVLKNSEGTVIGNVRVKMDDSFVIVAFLAFAFGLILVGVLSLGIAVFIGKLLSLPVSRPICCLEDQFRAAASGDYEATMKARITPKRPLREIESLAQSTNMIINKMKEYNELLTSQNEELEAQNEELESQKEQIKEAQTQLVQNEKMASVGQLTAAITHEINTPLGAVKSNVQLCEMLAESILGSDEVKASENLRNSVNELLEANKTSVLACTRISEIIRSLKNFSKLDQAEFQEANLEENIKSVLILTSNLWKHNITIHEEYSPLPAVRCFPGMLNQVFMNLIVNAIQAIPDHGDIYIKTYSDEKNIYVSIKDTGTGIKGEDLERIFESGYSTKKTGMGLGLSLSTNIMHKHNGELRVTSEPGKGTEFIVCIPKI